MAHQENLRIFSTSDDAERFMRLANSRLHDAIASSGDAFALFDAEDRLTLWNPTFEDVLKPYRDRLKRGLSFRALCGYTWDAMREGRRDFGAASGREVWIMARLRAHREACGVFDCRTHDNRWIRFTERPTQDGGVVLTGADITDLIAARREAEARALRDPATGLANRLAFEARLEDDARALEAPDAQLSIVMVEAEGLTRLLAQRGRLTADRAAAEIAHRLEALAQPDEQLARLSVEVFAIATPAGPPRAAALAVHAVAVLETPLTLDEGPAAICASAGGAHAPGHGREPALLLSAAEAAMRRARDAGGGYVEYHAA